MFAAAAIGVEDRVAAATRGLGPVHGGVGGLQEFIGGGVFGASLHDADARGDGEVVAVDVERFGECLEYQLRDRGHGFPGLRDQDDEFVAAHARHQLVGLGAGA